MRYTTLLLPLLTTSICAAAIPNQQTPLPNIGVGPAMPQPTDTPTSSSANGDTVILSDVIGNSRSINIFAGLTRDFANISERFEDSKLNTTILAPENKAIMALPRKPWEDPKDYDTFGEQAYEGSTGEDRAHKNIRRFVEEHVVLRSPWKEGEKVKTLSGGSLWWEMRGGAKFIQPGDIEVSEVASRVHNGEVWILKGVRNYA